MSELEPDPAPRSTLQVFLGFLLGIAASLGCLFLAVLMGSALGFRYQWIYPLFIAISLIGIGIVSYRHWRESSLAVGVVIALGLALLVDAACAVSLIR